MKKLIVFGCATLALMAFAEPATKKPMSDADKAARKAKFYQKTGGLIRKPGTGSGKLAFVNAQSRFQAADIQAVANQLTKSMMIDFVVVPGKDVGFSNAVQSIKGAQASAGVILTTLDKSMPELTVVPDQGYAILNQAAMPADADAKYLQKQLMRAIAGAAGAMSSQYPMTLMSSFDNSKKLAAFPTMDLPADVMMRVKNALKQNGVAPYAVTTYKHACREGWAPAPKNDVEKAIWKEMNDQKERGPANAIKIEP